MTHKKFHFIFTCLVLSLLCFCTCSHKKVTKQYVPPEEQSAFYTFSATRDTVKNLTVFALKNITLVNTKIKYKVDEAKAKEPYYLRVQIIGNSDNMVQAVIEHPLYKRMEVFSEEGQIESNLISLPQAEFTLRIPYFEEHKKIKIMEVINFKESSPIILKNEK